jgi:vitamin B12 transporter
MKRILRFCFMAVCWALAPAWAQEATPPAEEKPVQMEEVVVTATRTPVPAEETGVSYTVITDKEMQERQATRVEEVLRAVPGVTINQTGGQGGTTSLFMRGGDSNNTQVLFNGIRMNDAGGDFDFNSLLVDNLERIEVIRGPMSALYGADAMTGMINLLTKKGVGPPTFTVNSEIGAHSENGNLISQQKASLLGSYNNFAYSIAYSRIDDNGILKLNNRFGSNVLNSRLDLDALDNLSFKFVTLLIDSRSGFPTVNGGDRLDPKSVGGPGLDPDRNTTKLDVLLGLTTNYNPFKWWEHELTLGYSLRDRHFNDPFNPQTDADVFFGAFFSRNLEQRYSLDYHTNFRLGARETMEAVTTLGVAARTEQLKQILNSGQGDFFGFIIPASSSYLKTSRQSTAFYFQEQYSLWQRLFLTAGFRYDDNSVFAKPEFVPRASASFKILETDTVLRAAGGKAIKEPTFLQSFSRDQLSVANPKLRPEKNVGWEAGADQFLFKNRLKFAMTYFENHFTDFITFVNETPPTPSTYQNIGAVRTTGLEFALKTKAYHGLSLGAAYTHFFQFTVLNDDGHGGLYFATGRHLLRRPRNAFSFDADYVWRRLGLHLNGLYTGRRDDTAFPTLFTNYRVVNGGFFVLNVAATYDLLENWGYIKKVQLLARVNNLFDRFYEEVYGFSSPRFNAVAGVRLVF